MMVNVSFANGSLPEWLVWILAIAALVPLAIVPILRLTMEWRTRSYDWRERALHLASFNKNHEKQNAQLAETGTIISNKALKIVALSGRLEGVRSAAFLITITGFFLLVLGVQFLILYKVPFPENPQAFPEIPYLVPKLLLVAGYIFTLLGNIFHLLLLLVEFRLTRLVKKLVKIESEE